MSEDLNLLADQLAVMLEKTIDDLSAEIRHRYAGTLNYPSERRRYANDMMIVDEALLLLARYHTRGAP